MKKSLLVISFLALLLVACDQTGLGVGAAFKNLISLPVQGAQKIANSISGKTYEAYKERTTQGLNRDGSSCFDSQQGSGSSSQFNQLSRIACQCKAWATCLKELCSCNVMCPENFNIFNRPDYSLEPTEANSLSFVNSSSAFKNNKMTQGYCWGHAAITQRFNRLGFFDSAAQPVENGRVLDEGNDPQTWKEYYSKLIDKIADNEAAEIPGFANLGEFSRHPVIQEMLADKVAKTWADNAMSFNGLSAGLDTAGMTLDKSDLLFKNLKERVTNHQSPQLIITSKEQKFMTHVFLVSDVQEVNGEKRICLNDNNYPVRMNKKCNTYIRVTKDGRMLYPEWGSLGELGTVQVTKNEDTDTVKQVDALVKHCRGQRSCES